MNRRQYLTEREKLAMLKAQGWKCVCREGCGQPLWPGAPVRWDHRPPLALGGTRKPNQAVTPHCHDWLTRRDVSMIRKADRQEKAFLGLKKRKGRKLQSRGFDTRYRKKMNGEVVAR